MTVKLPYAFTHPSSPFILHLLSHQVCSIARHSLAIPCSAAVTGAEEYTSSTSEQFSPPMAPSPLHGLNIVHTDAPPSPDQQYGDSSQDPLLANAPFPDLAAQLDLWSNLTFQTDEPLVDKHARKPTEEDQEDKDDEGEVEGPASLEGHVNAVNPTAVSNTFQQIPPNYDLGSFLAGYGIDPISVPQIQAPPQPPHAATLAQLLAAYPFTGIPFALPPHVPGGVPPSALSTGQQQQVQQLTTKLGSETTATSPSSAPTGPPAKRARTRKSTLNPSSPLGEGSEDGASPAAVDEPNAGGAVLSQAQAIAAAEDKRRRNTAASARFRLKKKEREAALERRAQELEQRVNMLEKECEGLRRENGWLKGLVVGVTGASQGTAAHGVQGISPSSSNSSGNAGLGSGSGTGAKRKRVNVDDGAKAGEGEEKKTAVAV